MKYKDDLGRPISEQQVKNLDNYDAISYIGEQIKKIESFRKLKNYSKKTISYFLSTDENKNEIVQKYTSVDENMACVVYLNKQNSGSYNLWDWEQYNASGKQIFKGQEVFDERNRTIFYCSFDLNTNLLEPNSFKYFYGNKFEGDYDDILLHFYYHADGQLELIFDKHGNYGYSKGISLEQYLDDPEFSQVKFPWVDHPYYHSAYPFLPDGNL